MILNFFCFIMAKNIISYACVLLCWLYQCTVNHLKNPRFPKHLVYWANQVLGLVESIKESDEVIHYRVKTPHTRVVIVTCHMTNTRPLPVQCCSGKKELCWRYIETDESNPHWARQQNLVLSPYLKLPICNECARIRGWRLKISRKCLNKWPQSAL